MQLIMTGGGASEHFEEIDTHFIGLLGIDPTLLYIPLAGDDWQYGHERINTVFSTIEFNDIKMCTDLSELTWDYLKQFSAIYFDGGNTFQLMSCIRNTHTYELLHRFLNNGGVINGDSAGAIILGSHLETAHMGEIPDVNDSNLISYQGLNLLGNLAIHCHYDSSDDNEIIVFSKDYGFPVLALHEETAIHIDNGICRVIGKQKASLFKGEIKMDILVGEKVHL
jgi:dipeptidase E